MLHVGWPKIRDNQTGGHPPNGQGELQADEAVYNDAVRVTKAVGPTGSFFFFFFFVGPKWRS